MGMVSPPTLLWVGLSCMPANELRSFDTAIRAFGALMGVVGKLRGYSPRRRTVLDLARPTADRLARGGPRAAG